MRQSKTEGILFMFDEGASPVRKSRKGNIEEGFAEADFIVEGTTHTGSGARSLETTCTPFLL
jgi:hypothetical protein